MDASSLSHMTQAEFEEKVAAAIALFPRDPDDPTHRLPPSPSTGFSPVPPSPIVTDLGPALDDSESPSLIQRPELSFPNATKAIYRSTERLVSKPLGAIGRIFDQLESLADGSDASSRPQNYAAAQSDHSADSYYRSTAGRPASIRSNRSGYRQHSGHSSSQSPSQQQALSNPAYPSSPHYVPISQTFPQSHADPAFIAPSGYHGVVPTRRRTNSGLNVEEITLESDRQHEQQRLASIEVIAYLPLPREDETDGSLCIRRSRAFSRNSKRRF